MTTFLRLRTSLLLVLAAIMLPPSAAAQDAPPRISVTDAHFLMTAGAPGADDPYWVLTLQHFSTWRYGSNFFFVDLVDSPGLGFFQGEPGLYLEYAPVFSLSGLGILPMRDGGVLRDVGVTAQINAGWTAGSEAGAFPIDRVFLEGVELAWSVPRFAVFNTQLLARQERGHDFGWQFTWVYTLPFSLGSVDGMLTGFVDVWNRAGGPENESYAVVVAQPQLLLRLNDHLQIGVEIEPSHNFPNRFISDGWNVAVSPMLRWFF